MMIVALSYFQESKNVVIFQTNPDRWPVLPVYPGEALLGPPQQVRPLPARVHEQRSQDCGEG